MSGEFHQAAELAIGGDDMRRLLSEIVCPSYGPFGTLRVTTVHEVEGGGFLLTLGPKPKPPVVIPAVEVKK